MAGFVDRTDAGRALATALLEHRGDDVVVLGLARGGVPVAAVVAAELGAALDVIVARKLGMPGHEELALGAITGARIVVNSTLIRDLGVTDEEVDRIADREQRELHRRERAYRQGRPPVEVRDRTVVLVDDGVATGATMRVAALALRDAGTRRLVIAVPTGPAHTPELFDDLADDVVCLESPRSFSAVGMAYRDFSQVSDAAVTAALET